MPNRLLLALALSGSVAARAYGAAPLPLDLPIRDPARSLAGFRVAGPAWAGDVLELRLAPPAARAVAAGADAGIRRARLGLVAVDRVAAELGGAWFETEFRGERPPPPGSPQPDLTAFYVVHLPAGATLESALDRFARLPEVAVANPIAILPVDAIPNDSLYSSSWWFPRIEAPAAWDVTTGDSSIVIAIIDTGILAGHPDLGGTTAGQAGQLWLNRAEQTGVPGVDEDANGFIDDVSGWDFVDLPDTSDVATGEDWRDPDNDPNDFVAHGTAVAGIAGALTNNLHGVSGMTWNVRLMPLRVGWAYRGARLGAAEVRMDFAAQAIRYATRMGARVINCSFESINQAGLDAAVSAATGAGVTIVAAAGNNGTPFHYLGDRSDVISVAASDPSDGIVYFSNTGSYVDLAAPGIGIASTWLAPHPPGADSLGNRQPAYASGLNGTSFAAPVVTGTVALVHARRAALGLPPLPPAAVLLRLWETADDISAQNPGLTGYGSGRLNSHRAISELPGSAAVPLIPVRGAAVVLPLAVGPERIVVATADARLVVLDGATLETLASTALGGSPARGPAAADLGGGRGIGIFVGTVSGELEGFDPAGRRLPGWPVRDFGSRLGGGPALGDLDGDGVLEVLCGDEGGRVWAWNADGSRRAGFPVAVSSFGILPVALSDLDGAPGVEIVAAAEDGQVTVLRGDGTELPGWPRSVAGEPLAPLVMRLGDAMTPAVVLAEGNNLHAFGPDGAERSGFPVALTGSVVREADLAAGDLDLDGSDEIVVPTSLPNRIEVLDSAGVSLAPGWPRLLFDPPAGSPVLGHLSGGGAPELLILRGQGLLALSSAADSLASFPKPGGAGASPTISDLDGDGRSQVVAGGGPDSVLYIYDGGPMTWDTAPQPWPTMRGNFARTGSRLYDPGLPALDLEPPARVTDLAVDSLTARIVGLTWSAPADPGSGGAAAYQLRRATFPLDEGNDSSGIPLNGIPVPGAPGTREHFIDRNVLESVTYWYALRSRDAAGNLSQAAIVAVAVPGVRPAPILDLSAIAASDSSILLTWTASGDDSLIGLADHYLVHGALAPLDESTFEQAPLAIVAPATAAPGDAEVLAFGALAPGTRYWLALVAVDDAGNRSRLSNVASDRTLGGAPARSPAIALAVRANPSRLPALFQWQAAPGAEAEPQRLSLYDVSGRRVASFGLGKGPSGVFRWDGRDGNGRAVPAGLYIARLDSGTRHRQARVVILP